MHDLTRFLEAQASGVYERALGELQNGCKESHWMWFIFPQIRGLGHSPMAQRFAIADFAEAKAYLQHPVLGARLKECCAALLVVEEKSASEIMGYPDDLKLRSSMTLFSLGEGTKDSIFTRVLTRFFEGESDAATLERLAL